MFKRNSDKMNKFMSPRAKTKSRNSPQLKEKSPENVNSPKPMQKTV